jgi:hypothetical protein
MIAVRLSPLNLVRDRPSLVDVAVVSLCPRLQRAAASTQLSMAPRGGLASGHGGPSRTQSQAVSCLVVVSCCWRSLSKKAPASCRSVPFTHAMVDGVAATPGPATNATEHARKAQFLLSPMLHLEVIHADLAQDEALLAMVCFAWTCYHYMHSSSAQIPRVRDMYTETKYPPRAQ